MACAIQNSRDKKRLGAKAPWYAVWRDADGKQHTLKVGKLKDAKEIASARELNAKKATSGIEIEKAWSEFRAEYEQLIVPKMRSAQSREMVRYVLRRFEELVHPRLVGGITRKTLDQFVSRRLRMPGLKRGSTVSAETIKKDLRTIRAALNQAHEWGYLPVVSKMPTVPGLESEKRFVTPEHFDVMSSYIHVASYPAKMGYEPWLWWDALLSLLWVAPLRISAMLALRWDHTDLANGVIVSRPKDTKQKKSHRACIPPVVCEKLERIRRFDPRVFPWNNSRRTLYREFTRIQQAARIHLSCDGDHEHSESCHVYGFHDFRRSFATLNGELPVSFQQSQMGHSSYQTTMEYVRYSQRQQMFADRLHLPDSLKAEKAVV